mgnify:CR=1 FL=1
MNTCAIIDTHAHLDEFSDPQAVIQEAEAQGVVAIVAVGQDRASNSKAMRLAARYPGLVFPAIGYHPWRIDPETDRETLAQIDENLDHCVALGEVGLDYKAKAKKKVQKQVFQELIALANAHDKPMILHCRYSHARAHQMVKDAGVKRAVFHWYSGPIDLVPEIAASGYYMSACPALIYNPYHIEAIRAVPLSSLLLETDCPVTYQTLESRPVHVRLTLEKAAEARAETLREIADATTANARRCFGI